MDKYLLNGQVGKSAEVGILGFSSSPQTCMQNLLWTEVRRELGIHFCFTVPGGHSGGGLQTLRNQVSSYTAGVRSIWMVVEISEPACGEAAESSRSGGAENGSKESKSAHGQR